MSRPSTNLFGVLLCLLLQTVVALAPPGTSYCFGCENASALREAAELTDHDSSCECCCASDRGDDCGGIVPASTSTEPKGCCRVLRLPSLSQLAAPRIVSVDAGTILLAPMVLPDVDALHCRFPPSVLTADVYRPPRPSIACGVRTTRLLI